MSYRIAILDDEELVRDGIKLKLPFIGPDYEVVYEHHNGKAALEELARAKEQPVDIYFVDIVMPMMSGLDFVREAGSLWPDIAFVIVSGHDDFHYAKTAIQLGVRDYLLKPVLVDELKRVLGSIEANLAGKRAEEEELRRFELSAWLSSKGFIPLADKTVHWLEKTLLARDQLYLILVGNTYSPHRDCPNPFRQEMVFPLFLGSHGNTWACLSRSRLLADDAALNTIGTLTVAHIADVASPESLLKAAATGAEWVLENVALGRFRHVRLDAKDGEAEPLSKPVPAPILHTLQQLKREHRYEQALQVLTSLLNGDASQRLKEQGVRYFAEYFLHVEVSLEWLQSFDDPDAFAEECLRFVRSQRDEPHAQSGKEIVHSVIRSLRQEYGLKKTLQDYADERGIHPNHLARLFRTETNRTFLGLLTEIRMEKAAVQLEESGSSVAQIALETGYEDARYFSQVFRRQFGVTPTEYRQRAKEGREG